LITIRGVKVTEDDLTAIAAGLGYEFKGNEKAEFTTLLAATCNAMQFVEEMDGLISMSELMLEILTSFRLSTRTPLQFNTER
jgi:hypothetical protein